MLNKFYNMLGFAMKSGNLVTGAHTCELNIPTKKISLLIIAQDASDNTKEKFKLLANSNNCKYIIFDTKENLSKAIGKYNRNVYGITNKKFSREIIKIYEEIVNSEERGD